MGEDAVAIQRRLSACFSGKIDRDCSTCPGHYTKGGRCCFGYRYDPRDDDQCMRCVHRGSCAIDTARYNGVSVEPRTTSIIRTPAPTSTTWVNRSTTSAPTLQSPNYPSAPSGTFIGEMGTDDPPFVTFMKHIVWKALEGFFRGAYEYFYHTRWSSWRP